MPDYRGHLILAQEPTRHYTPEQRAAVKHWAIWTGGLILGGLMIIGVVLVVLHRQRRTLLGQSGKRRKRRRSLPDAWTESGKRMDPAAIAAREDTVDIDPDDLGPHDVEGDEDQDPHGEGPRR